MGVGLFQQLIAGGSSDRVVPIQVLEQAFAESYRCNPNDCSIDLKGATVSGTCLTGAVIPPFSNTTLSNGVLEVHALGCLRNMRLKNMEIRAPDLADVVIVECEITLMKCSFAQNRGSLLFCEKTKVGPSKHLLTLSSCS